MARPSEVLTVVTTLTQHTSGSAEEALLEGSDASVGTRLRVHLWPAEGD
jgi:hypothetical protein